MRFLHVRTEEGIEDGISIPNDAELLEERVAELAASLVVIDPLVAHLPGSVDSFKDQSVRRALAPLHRLAEAQHCAVVALIHLNKAQGLAPLARLSGSGAFGNMARSVLLLDRDPDDDENGPRRVLAHVKCNAGPLMPSLLYEIEPVVLPEQEGQPRVETARMRLLGESEHDGASLLAVPSGEARSAVDEACEFLLAELGEGCGRADEVLSRARRLGHSEPTVRRARTKLGIETSKEGFEGHWRWCIPKASTPLTPSQVTPSTPSRNHADLPPFESTKASVSGDDAFDHVQAEYDYYQSVLDRPPLVGDDGYLDWLYERFERELVTEGEWRQLDGAHRLIVSSKASKNGRRYGTGSEA